ncbi:MAG TPA: TatD family nuclease-associated radical SAM protein, partial [Planctomycetota bacterium]|nr:TatD family nuclease-associated radical SAM protein [Planctomycetota bacterium]
DPASDLTTSRKVIALAERYDGVYAAVGVHPHEVSEFPDKALPVLRELAAHEKVVAIGEIGLDYYRDLSPRDLQREVFLKQIDVALELDLPVIVHSRDAHLDVAEILRQVHPSGNLRGVLHCFSGALDWAQRAVEMGFCIGFDGPLTWDNADDLRDIAAAVPLEHTLLETDAPYLTPAPRKRSERNEPVFVTHVAEALARIRGLSVDDVARVTSLAAARLFDIPCADQASRIAYVIRNSLYLNVTNRCSNDCTFCTRRHSDTVKGHRLVLDREPTAGEIETACGDVSRYDEVVFCGYGEPTERLDVLKELARWVKDRGRPVRVVTNGEGDLINGRSIAPELAGLVDRLSVSVNTADAAQHVTLCRSRFGADAYPAILKFIESAKPHVPEIEITAVAAPGVDMRAVEDLARKLGVSFRARRYNETG